MSETMAGADPGFTVGGGANPQGGGRQHTNLPDFPKNGMKWRKFWSIGERPRWIRHWWGAKSSSEQVWTGLQWWPPDVKGRFHVWYQEGEVGHACPKASWVMVTFSLNTMTDRYLWKVPFIIVHSRFHFRSLENLKSHSSKVTRLKCTLLRKTELRISLPSEEMSGQLNTAICITLWVTLPQHFTQFKI